MQLDKNYVQLTFLMENFILIMVSKYKQKNLSPKTILYRSINLSDYKKTPWNEIKIYCICMKIPSAKTVEI